MDEFSPETYKLGKKECLDCRLGLDIQNVDLNVTQIQTRQENNTGKILGIVLKGVFFSLVKVMLPLIQKQRNHMLVTWSWDSIPLLVVGLTVSYDLIARQLTIMVEKDENNELYIQGTQDYV